MTIKSFYLSIRIIIGFVFLIALSACNSGSELDLDPVSTVAVPVLQPEVISAGYTPSVVVLWNEAALAAVRNGPSRPTVITRSMFMLHTAMFDAWSVYDDVAEPVALSAGLRRFPEERTAVNKEAAVAQAAYQTLVYLYPEYERDTQAFSSLLTLQGFEPFSVSGQPEGAPLSPDNIGYMASKAAIQARENDGSNHINDFVDTTSRTFPELYTPLNSDISILPGAPDFDVRYWQPLRVPTGKKIDAAGQPQIDLSNPLSYEDQAFLTPHWGAVKPFALSSGDQFRPIAPPMPGSDEPYQDSQGNVGTNNEIFEIQVAEVIEMSANLTDEHKVIAEYWADGPRSETPPGHWNALAHGISERDQHSLDDDIKFYFALNCALFDAGISAWEAKRAFDYVRPISAIQHLYSGQMIEAWAGPNEGTQLIPAEAWRPYQQADFVTPPFAEYVSGHSTFSAAAAEVFATFTGSDRYYDGETVLYHTDFNEDGVPDLLGQHIVPVNGNKFERSPSEVIVLQWDTFSQAADEAGYSRLYGGIHFAEGDLSGRKMGREIGVQSYALAQAYWQGKE
ncbi:MAG: vanadium-dependent haloperoxidase [Anaerolineae bacterium]